MKIIVIGDYISDVYTFGTATRLCPEAPVPIVVPECWKESWGGAGLVCEQLASLVWNQSVEARFLSFSKKQRFFAGNHLICRLDEDGCKPDQEHLLMPVTSEDLENFDAFVVSDYGKGGMTWDLSRQIVDTGKPCFVDSKNAWDCYEGQNVTLFPNEIEAAQMQPLDYAQFGKVVNKLGARGCRMGTDLIPATVSEVVDVTGAGDIFMASFVYAWSIQLPPEHCLRFANEMAGESCRHRGTFVVGREFAQSVLDRLRASQASEQQVRGSSLDSSQSAIEQQNAQDQIGPSAIAATIEILRVNYPQAVTVTLGLAYIPQRAQTLHQSPLVPTGSSGTPIQEGQDILREPNGTPPWEG